MNQLAFTNDVVVANGLPPMFLLLVLENGPTLIAGFSINLITALDTYRLHSHVS